MATSFGSFSDFLPSVEVKCRIRGCENTVHLSGEEALQKVVQHKGGQSDRMCDECFERLKTLQDKELPCSKPDCQGTWVWNRYQQLEAYARSKGKDVQPPKGLCEECRKSMAEFTPQERPCRVKGCKNTWTWTAKDQILAQGKQPAPRFCEECYTMMKKLQDKELPCRVKGCKNHVVWSRYQQLEYIRAGKDISNPPSRMCDECIKLFGTLKDEEKECKINGCKNTWVLSAFEQLEVLRNTPEGQEPAMPNRMCKQCFNFYANAKDEEMPCRVYGCQNTWTWTRSMQLGAHVHGIERKPARLCEECSKILAGLQDKEEPCSANGCKGTWIYNAEDQLRDLRANKSGMRKHRCPECTEFLKTHQAETLTCSVCGQEFQWSPQEQLATKLGEFEKPIKCPGCVRREIGELTQMKGILSQNHDESETQEQN